MRADDPRGWLSAVVAALALGCAATGGGGRAVDGDGGPDGAAGSGGAGGSAAGGTGGSVASGGASAGTGGTTAGGASGGGSGGNVEPGDASTAHADAGHLPGDGGLVATRAIAAAPVYLGTRDDAAPCNHEYHTSGFEPDDPPGTRHPLFLHFVGTNFVYDDATFRQQVAPAVDAITLSMAKRGFVALNVDYDNTAIAWLSDHVAQLECLFGDSNPASILAVACALPTVDCDLGIATSGHSQGALVAHLAVNHDPRVRAAWLAGYGGDGRSTLSTHRMRVVNGEFDTTNGQVGTLNGILGFTATECPDDGRSTCLRADGSGWIIVRRADCVTSTADHCWFDKVTCTDAQPTLEPNWVDPSSTKPFALEANSDWLAATVRRP